MKQLRYLFMAFAVTLLATSCSQDELPGGGSADEPGQPRAYTFTVSPDLTMEGDAAARSEGTDTEMPTRCFMQVFDNGEPVNTNVIEGEKKDGSFIFTVTLASGKSYDYCFYADNGTANITDLSNITWPNTGDVVAYAHKLSGKPEEEMSVTLTHIVTKITLKHVGEPFTVAAGEEFKISYPCADAYNVLNNAASTENGYEDFTYTFTEETTINNGDEVCSFYTTVPYQVENNPDITLNLHHLTQTISDIEWKINSHVTLQGDLSESNPKWGATKEYVEKQIDFFFTDENGDPEGNLEDGVYLFYLPAGNITDLEAVLSAIFHKNVELDFTKNGYVFEEIYNDYTFVVRNYATDGKLDILINGRKTYMVCTTVIYSGYENFSVVSNKLNQSTI